MGLLTLLRLAQAFAFFCYAVIGALMGSAASKDTVDELAAQLQARAAVLQDINDTVSQRVQHAKSLGTQLDGAQSQLQALTTQLSATDSQLHDVASQVSQRLLADTSNMGSLTAQLKIGNQALGSLSAVYGSVTGTQTVGSLATAVNTLQSQTAGLLTKISTTGSKTG